jgi:hypothetical protein
MNTERGLMDLGLNGFSVITAFLGKANHGYSKDNSTG